LFHFIAPGFEFVNHFFNIPSILSRELLPWESARRGLSVTTGQFELAQTIRFRSDTAGGIIQLDEGEISDLASIPDAAAAIFGINTDDQRIAGGAWFHDHIYRNFGKILVWDETCSTSKAVTLTRKQADNILCYEAMPDLGASFTKCAVAYQALRRFGCQWPGNSFWERFT
jgi:hypothetical protein